MKWKFKKFKMSFWQQPKILRGHSQPGGQSAITAQACFSTRVENKAHSSKGNMKEGRQTKKDKGGVDFNFPATEEKGKDIWTWTEKSPAGCGTKTTGLCREQWEQWQHRNTSCAHGSTQPKGRWMIPTTSSFKARLVGQKQCRWSFSTLDNEHTHTCYSRTPLRQTTSDKTHNSTLLLCKRIKSDLTVLLLEARLCTGN